MSKEWLSNFIYVFSLVFGDPLETVRFSAHKVAKWKDRLFGKGPKEKLKTEIFSVWCQPISVLSRVRSHDLLR